MNINLLQGKMIKDISGFEQLYKIISDGQVFSIRNKKMLTPRLNGRGYLHVTLCNKGIDKNVYLHRLVGLAFIPNLDNKSEINHKDGNKLNNNYSNLEWFTRSENQLHSFRTGLHSHQGERSTQSKLNEKQVLEIRNLSSLGLKRITLSKIYSVNPVTISDIVHRKTWTHI